MIRQGIEMRKKTLIHNAAVNDESHARIVSAPNFCNELILHTSASESP